MNVPVAILAGGLATRLRPLTEKVPKVLLAVAGKPFLAHQLELLRAQGIRRAVLCVGHLGEMVEKEFGDGRSWGMELSYSFDGPVLLGTGGALRQALPKLGESFFVLYGDSYLTAPFAPIAEFFQRSGQPGLMTVYCNEGLYDTSNVVFRDGRIVVYDKKRPLPEMRHIDYGLSLFRASVFSERPAGQAFDLAEVMRDLVGRGQLAGYEVAERFYEIGSPAGLAELERALKKEGGRERGEGRGAVFLDRDGVINRALERDGKPYPPRNLDEFEILPDVPEACAKLKNAGFKLVVATNQPDVGRGTLDQSVVTAIHEFMCRQLPIDRVEVCFHPGQGASDCDCRKPRPGMLLRAARALGLDLAQSWMVGDRWRDIDCGHAAGCRTIFIDRGYAEELRQPPEFRARGLLEAAEIILRH